MGRQKNNTSIIISLFMAFYIIWQTPIVALYTNTYMAMGLLVFLTMLLMLKSDLVSNFPKLFVAVFFYFLLMAVDYAMSGGNILNNVWSIFLELFPIFIGYILVHNKLDRPIAVTVWLIILTYTVTALTTYIGLQTYPEASRILATGNVDYTPYYKQNIGGFGFIYTMVLIHPVVIGFLRQRRLLIPCIAYSVICGMCVFASAYTFAALLFIGSCIAYLLPVRAGTKFGKKQISLLVLLLVIVMIFLPAILRTVAKWEVLEISESKIEDVANMLQGKETEHEDTEIRKNAYERSIETFLENPIFGAKLFGSRKNSGHSFLFDMLANWGLVGIAIVAFLYYRLGKQFVFIASKSNALYFAILALLMAIVLSLLNNGSWSFVLGLVIPLFLYSFKKTERGDENIVNEQ